MLLLESERPTGDHAWDKAHPGLDTTDPADDHNCVLASLAMLNHFFGGNLSQDRIGYEVRKDRQPGPELDLNYGAGLYPDQIAAAFQLALGVAPEKFAIGGSTADDRWDFITSSIDGGRPISAAIPGHAIVVTGYLSILNTRYVVVNDPWAGPYNIPLEGIQLTRLWRPSAEPQPTSDEPEISADSDGDGIVDFDEINRFHTKPLGEDTDGDEVTDRDDVKESVFGAWGYSEFGVAGEKAPRDWDDDGVPNERDCDSDNDGINDGDDPDDYSDPPDPPDPDPPDPAVCLTSVTLAWDADVADVDLQLWVLPQPASTLDEARDQEGQPGYDTNPPLSCSQPFKAEQSGAIQGVNADAHYITVYWWGTCVRDPDNWPGHPPVVPLTITIQYADGRVEVVSAEILYAGDFDTIAFRLFGPFDFAPTLP